MQKKSIKSVLLSLNSEKYRLKIVFSYIFIMYECLFVSICILLHGI